MGGWYNDPRHTYHEETINARRNQEWASQYREWAYWALQAIYRELDYERDTVRNSAYAKAIESYASKAEIEWQIYEIQVKKAQANYIANYYTNKILTELRNLESILNEK